MDKNEFTRDWLVCTQSFKVFEKDKKYLLSITLDPNVYDAIGEECGIGEVEITDDELFGHFEPYKHEIN